MNMKRILAALLACVMVLGLAACGSTDAPDAQQPDAPALEMFSASYGESYEDSVAISLFAMEGEQDKFELVYSDGMEETRGYVGTDLMTTLAGLYNNSELPAMEEKSVYGEGEANGALSVSFADGTMTDFSFGGEVPEAFVTVFQSMDEAVKTAMETMEPYKAHVEFTEDVNADVKAALEAVFAHLGNEALDMTMGMNVAADDPNYANMIGLDTMDESKDMTPIVNAVLEQASSTTVVQNMMGTMAHQVTVFQLNDGADAAALGASLMENAGWRKWICVNPNMALTATKDNLLLFSLTLTDIGTDLVAGLEAEGWTVTATAENPDAGDGAMAAAPEL